MTTRSSRLNRLWYGEEVTIIGTVQEIRLRPIRGGSMKLVDAVVSDGSGALRVTWFNQGGRRDCDWFRRNVAPTTRVVVSDVALNPDATRALITLGFEARRGQLSSVLVVLDLDRRRPDWQ